LADEVNNDHKQQIYFLKLQCKIFF
jgi:hypothetical protein